MPILKDCVVMGDKVYCWDETNQRFTEAELTPKTTNGKIPEEAMKEIFKKRFNLKE